MGGMIRQAGIMGANFGGTEDKIALTHPQDIADEAVKQLLALDFKGYTTQYNVSDERTSGDISRILGTAIGQPALPWIAFSDEDSFKGLSASRLK